MKKSNVIQLAIILAGLVLGFQSLQRLITSFYGIFAWLNSTDMAGFDYFGPVLVNSFWLALEVFFSWLLIIKSDSLSAWIQKKTNYRSGFNISANPHELLYILLITIGLYLLAANITPLLSAVYEKFIHRVPRGVRGLFEDGREVEWLRLVLNLIVPLILLMFAKPIADYFAKHIGEDPVVLEESIGEDKTTTSQNH